ncbi:OmpP1/FadL family transporter [Paracoccus marinaquae]|uniref:Outer membrane protein transport protein n=1 Tax=Paracoccus marinaquae TaxID=2841926 RepID=A0ABS6AF84_9RHOB|nr:outer membrane protein transport protein [Paracoccus marinaquae]MBU3029265.1 outer membrane protein transport protein [Paracoccus marinaquae]
MKLAFTGVAALLMGASPLLAGGIERAPQSLSPLFEPATNYVELSFGSVSPDISGRDAAMFGGSSFGNVADDYAFVGLAYKRQFNENFSAALIFEQPFGADLYYPLDSIALGGTAVTVDSTTFTALLRYRMDNNFGVHGGIRGSRADANLTLAGLAYGGLNGYNLNTESDTGIGWVAGVSWEKPEIAARVSLTYNSPINHTFDTSETLSGGPFGVPNPAGGFYGPDGEMEVDTPRSVNLEFQTGVAADTLVFGSVRWVKWSEFLVMPPAYSHVPEIDSTTGLPTGNTLGSLVSLDDSTTWTIGAGRKFTDTWSGAASFFYEKSDNNDLVSPLAPTNGRKGITLAAIYTQGPLKITTAFNYTKLGDAAPETGTPDTARAYMDDSDAWGVGMRIGYSF